MKNKTCSRFVLLKNDTPQKIIQPEWFKYNNSFSRSRGEMHNYMDGLCTGLGPAYSYEDYHMKKHAHLNLLLEEI